MKKAVNVFICAFVMIMCVSAALPAAQKVLLVTGEWIPYTGKNIPHYGFFTEIVTAVFKEMGVDAEYRFYPWKRCELMVKSGEAYAAFPYRITSEREKEFNFSSPVAFSTGRFFYYDEFVTGDVVYASYKDLKPYKIGGVLGYWYEKDFNDAGLNVEYVASDDQNIKKLKIGRVQLAAMDEIVGWQLVQKYYPDEMHKFKVLSRPLNESDLRLMVSKKYTDADKLNDAFNAALKGIKAKGVYRAILKKYNMKE